MVGARWITPALTSILVAALFGAAAAATTIDQVSIERRGTIVELSFEFRGAPPKLKLSAEGSELRIDLDATRLEVPPRPVYGREAAPVAAVRAVSLSESRARIAIEVQGRTDYAIARLPRRIVLRLAPEGEAANIAAPLLVRDDERRPRHDSNRDGAARAPSIPAPSDPATRPALSPSRQLDAPAPPRGLGKPVAYEPPDGRRRPLVMIDPGHGGHDPGATSASGLTEKALALAIALRLRGELRARGVNAALTRDADVFIPLAERTRIANRAGADVFISIHLNASPNRATTGIETYYLDNTTDRATIRLAQIENASGARPGYGAPEEVNLNYILSDLRQQYKASESAALARIIDAQTAAELGAALGLAVNALGAKKGPFWVLVGAHMPAVLVECGFLSNAAEAERLASPAYQSAIARGIASAVIHYLNEDAAVGSL